MNKSFLNSSKAWTWIPSLYYTEGLPYVTVMTLSVIMYKRLEISNADIALYTSWLYLPWVIKPIWSPLLELFKTKRFWVVWMQLSIGASFACLAFTIPTSSFFQYTLAFFWLAAFSSATHDIAADGFYMMGLNEKEQSFFVGIRSTFYRIAMISGQGLLVIFAGILEEAYSIPFAWKSVFLVLSGFIFLMGIYHMIILPRPKEDTDRSLTIQDLGSTFIHTFKLFFAKSNIGVIVAFLLLYRLGEAQLAKMASPFLLDEVAVGGLGLSTTEVGFVYGTVGIISLVIGGILGGMLVARDGLVRWLWPMLFAINLPNIVYIFLAYTQINHFTIINICVAIEQFGYGFGFTAYMMYMIYVAKGAYKTAHYSLCTGFMALGMMIPGMYSGWIQEQIGYPSFFIWVFICTIPSFIVAYFLKIDPKFGKSDT